MAGRNFIAEIRALTAAESAAPTDNIHERHKTGRNGSVSDRCPIVLPFSKIGRSHPGNPGKKYSKDSISTVV